MHIVMELCEGPALTDAVSAGRLSDERDVAVIVSSILRFIAQCHGKGIVYRDVKPDNFLFVREGPTSPIKATDFGLSIRHSSGEAPLTSRSGTPAYMAPEVPPSFCFTQSCHCIRHALNVPADILHVYQYITATLMRYLFPACTDRVSLSLVQNYTVHHHPEKQFACKLRLPNGIATGAGRPLTSSRSACFRYDMGTVVAPVVRDCGTGKVRVMERVSHVQRACMQVIMQSYSSKADIWSVGMVTYQLLTGRFPFCDNIRSCSLQDVWKSILSESGRISTYVDVLEVSEEAKQFLHSLLVRDPSKRLSATQALQLPVRSHHSCLIFPDVEL